MTVQNSKFRVMAAAGLILAAASVALSAGLYVNSVNIRSTNRDQTCMNFELDERRAVRRVIDAYGFLDRLPESERGSNLTKEVVRALPERRQEAREEQAPAYCDRAGIGLPSREIPRLPKRRNFDHLLKG